jgi:hypothetical protein
LPEISPHEKVVNALALFYAVMGNPPEATGALNAMAADLLAERVAFAEISEALNRCRKECRFPVRLPDIWQRIPGREVSQVEAEMRAAWDVVVRYANKWLRWNCERTHACPDGDAPQLAQQIVDCVRRSGGWSAYLSRDPESAPFLQKRFFDEWKAWTATEPIVNANVRAALSAPQIKQLSNGKQMEKPAPRPATNKPQLMREITQQLTEEQIRDRKEMLRQQAAQILATRKQSGERQR